MDCQAVRGKIDLYIDGVLNPADAEPFLGHVESCQHCKKQLEDMMRLHRALRSLGDVEPPLGLAAAAARKARRRRSIPFAYISVGVAAALAFALVLTSVISPRANKSTDPAVPERYMMAAPSEEYIAFDAAGEAPAATEAVPAPAARAEPDMVATQNDGMPSDAAGYPAEAAEPESGELLQQKNPAHIMTAPAPSYIVAIPAVDERQANIRAALQFIIDEHGIEAFFFSDDAMDSISFVIPEAAVESISALAEDFIPDGEIASGEMIEFRFIK